jgi:tRNA nucleotidyltransferase (CCA-adding enzyme)
VTRRLEGIPERVQKLGRSIANAGGRLWIVGGWVRDRLLGRAPKDLDLVAFDVEGEALDRLLRASGSLQLVGRAFPVRKWFAGGAVHDVQLAPEGSDLASDASQRDLRIHAIYCDPCDGAVADPTGGLEDLQSRRLRIVGPSFSADPVRKLRLVRACASLGAEAEEEAFARSRAMALVSVARERVFEELRALLRSAAGLERVPELWGRAGVASDWPELAPALDAPAAVALGSRLRRLAESLAELADPFSEWLPFLAGAIAAPAERSRWLARLLDEASAAAATERVALDEHLERISLDLAAAEGERLFALDLELVRSARRGPSLRAALLRLEARRHPSAEAPLVVSRARGFNLDAPKLDPWISGRELRELGLAPGPGFGPLLERALTHQLRGDWPDRAAAQHWLVQEIACSEEGSP